MSVMRPVTVFLGDMNAQPRWPQIEPILDAGFANAWTAGEGPGYTAYAAAPRYRIDWIFHTLDLVARNAEGVR